MKYTLEDSVIANEMTYLRPERKLKASDILVLLGIAVVVGTVLWFSWNY